MFQVLSLTCFLAERFYPSYNRSVYSHISISLHFISFFHSSSFSLLDVQVQTWLDLKDKLMPNGRLMVNCGASTNINGLTYTQNSFRENNSTLDILCKAFPGQVSTFFIYLIVANLSKTGLLLSVDLVQVNWKKTPKSEGDNHLALTGPLPDLTSWAAALPDPLSSNVMQWISCFPS